MKFLLLLSFVSLANFSNGTAQVSTEWISKSNVPNGNETLVRDITTDNSGNVYVTGCCPVALHGTDFVTIKLNSIGEREWISYYNGTGNFTDCANCILVDDNGNVFVGGSSYTQDNLTDFLLVKYNSTGVEQWIQSYDGPGHLDDGINDMGIDNSGNIYVTGGSWGLPGAFGTNLDFATICYSNSGVRQWLKRYNGAVYSWDASCGLGVDSEGNIFVTGYSSEINNQSEDFTTIKYSSSGNIIWISHFDGPAHFTDNPTSMRLDNADNIYVTGFSHSANDYDYAVVKYNSAGEEKWSATYDGTANGWDYPNAVSTDTSGNVYVSGVSTGIGANEDYLTLKYDSTGILKWNKRFNNIYNTGDRLEGMVADKSGNVYVTGYSMGSPSTFNYLTIKYNTNGQEQWTEQFHENGTTAEYGRVLTIDHNNNVYVSGYTFGSTPSDNIVTIKYSQQTTVNNTEPGLINDFGLSQNYPNPFNPSTTIKFQLKALGNTILKVYDISGKEAATLVNQKLNAGSYSVQWNASNFSSGVYYYRLFADNNLIDAKKMILIK